MKIKEAENCVGISCKNIRFYEKEGLLYPKRNSENGYREYSKDDIKRLKKIKLLRKLGVSIEDIRELQAKKMTLSDVLKKRKDNIDNDINNLNKSKELCLNIYRQNITFDTLGADLWLYEMDKLEKKGINFVDINSDEIIKFLPSKFKTQFYESIIKNGHIDNNLLQDIIAYIKDIYMKQVDIEELMINTLKKINYDERNKLLLILKDNDINLFEKISKGIFDFEDIVNLDMAAIKESMEQFDVKDIVKATMGASPRVNEYLQNIFPDIDFVNERRLIGSIPIREVVNIQNDIIQAVNKRVYNS